MYCYDSLVKETILSKKTEISIIKRTYKVIETYDWIFHIFCHPNFQDDKGKMVLKRGVEERQIPWTTWTNTETGVVLEIKETERIKELGSQRKVEVNGKIVY